MTKIAFFDTKPYDKPGFEKYGPPAGIEFKYYDQSWMPYRRVLPKAARSRRFVNVHLNTRTIHRCMIWDSGLSRCARGIPQSS